MSNLQPTLAEQEEGLQTIEEERQEEKPKLNEDDDNNQEEIEK